MTAEAKIEAALRELLDAIMDLEGWIELESGEGGNGPVVKAYGALGEEVPDIIVEWLGPDEEE